LQVSDKGLLEIAEHEGIVPAPYLDSVGVWTWGIGHTAAAGDPDPAKMVRSMPADLDAHLVRVIDQFRIDVVRYAQRVDDAIKVPLAQHQFDALVSFDFNTGGIYRAQLTAAINRGDRDAARLFMGWLRPPEVRKRRTAEMDLYKAGNYDANGDQIPIWKTNGAGKLAGIVSTVTGAHLLSLMKAEPLPVNLPPMPDIAPALRIADEIDAAHRVLADRLGQLRPALAALAF
jgi:lysozyme